MSTKSRQVIYGGLIIGAKIRAEGAREAAEKPPARRIAPRRKHGQSRWRALAGQRSPPQPSVNVSMAECRTRASIPLDAIRRPRDTPIWKLEAALKCRSCGTRCYNPPVHMALNGARSRPIGGCIRTMMMGDRQRGRTRLTIVDWSSSVPQRLR